MKESSLRNLKLGPLKRSKPVVYDGNNYNSQADLARELDVAEKVVSKAIAKGWKVRDNYIDHCI